jgi:electron transfer flavoprotein alpha subunit
MSPEITIKTKKGFTRTVEVSKEALEATIVPVSMADFDLASGRKTASPETAKELMELAKALKDAAENSD